MDLTFQSLQIVVRAQLYTNSYLVVHLLQDRNILEQGCLTISFSVGQIFDSLRGFRKRMKHLLKNLIWHFVRNNLGFQFLASVQKEICLCKVTKEEVNQSYGLDNF